MSKVTKQSPHQHAEEPGQRVFSCIGDLLSHHARVAPDSPAILAPERGPLSYGALRDQADDVVRALRSFGIGRTDRVAVVLPTGAEAAVATIAVAAGAVCVPLHPGFAAEEWQRYFAELRVAALLTRLDMETASRGVAYGLGIPVIDLSPPSGEAAGAFGLAGSAAQRSAVDDLASGADDAFILLTSGTTSRPKMVPLTHAGVCRSAYNVGATIALRPQDRLLSVLPLFHAHGLISGLLATLAAGSSVVCPSGFDAVGFFGWMTKFRPTWYTAVPPIHRALISAARSRRRSSLPSSLRLIRSASSSLPPDVLGELEALFGVPVIETYGMTEAATQIAANPLERRKPGSVGKPAGAEIAVMDSDGRQLPAGEQGEVVLRGPTITRGYDNNDVATKSAFRNGWFRTGDLGSMDSDGYLFLAGRIKKADVINRGGQKVSPAEIERVLLTHPQVVEAVAFPIVHRRLGEDVAAAVVLRANAKVSPHRLRDFASQHLARFKLPGLIRIVPQIPKGPDGKIQRGALAGALAMTSLHTRTERGERILAPRSELQWQLAKTWAELLEVEEVGIDQDVFMLGADSLTVTQMLARLRARFGADFSFKDIFDAPTVAALAARIERSDNRSFRALPDLRHAPTDTHTPLSFQQQRIFLLSRLDPTGRMYHVVEAARLSGPLDPEALEASIGAICSRHEVLRSTFIERVGEPLQTATSVRPRLECLDLRPCAENDRAAAIEAQISQLMQQPFEFESAPPIRTRLLRLDQHDHALVIQLHHLITDGWSQRIFWSELEKLYGASPAVTEPGEVAIQYRHFVAWQRAWLQTPVAAEQMEYWRTQLDGLTELPLRTDRLRPETATGRGARHRLKLSRKLSRRVKSLSRTHNVTLFMTLLAAFQCLLHRYTQHEDIAVGSLIANRNQIQIEPLIGMFANAIVLRTDLSGDPSFSEVLRRVRQITLDAYRNQELPIEQILQALQVPRSSDRHALFQVMFILQKGVSKTLTLAGLSAQLLEMDPGIARSDLLLELFDADGHLGGWLEYSTDLFEAGTIARMAAQFRTLLESIVANPEQPVSRLTLLPLPERKQVVVDWNRTETRPPRLSTFAERFDRQAARTPAATAVSVGQVRLGYRELAHRASAIADRLAMVGVGTDDVVVLLAERGIDLLAAIIAVQRVGGAFLVLDPTIPAARMGRIIEHCGTRMVLTAQHLLTTLQVALSGMRDERRPHVLSLEQPARAVPGDRASAVRRAPSSLACVIYTSGSTGVPKGAMIEQRGLFNHLLSKISDLELSANDVVAQTAPQSFVISIWQFLAALMVGARVHVCADQEVRDPALLMQVIAREGITVLQIVPTLLREILQRAPNGSAFGALGRLRWLICTGETLAPDLSRDWLRRFPGVPILNAYGQTECSDDVATHRLTALLPSTATVPIGRAIANTHLYVLDPQLQPVPIGVAGELYVGGIAVGRGYLNDPEQTRRSFLRDPFSKRVGARLYRTGDLARWRADATLECLGRIDHQVKIRGCRVELEEVEHVLTQHPKLQSAAVAARDIGGDLRLVAHIVAADHQQPTANELSDFLKTRLPSHMIPAGYVVVDHLPVTPHGKLDRAALAADRSELSVAGGEWARARDATQEVLIRIWADILEVEAIGIFSNFFDLGGHSLLAGRVLARVATTFGVSLPIRTLFEASTVEALARRVDEAVATTQSTDARLGIARIQESGRRPVSIAQERVLRIERELPGLPQFNLPFIYRLEGPLNVPALERSLAEVVRRHDSLRVAFAWTEEKPFAVVADGSSIDAPLVVESLSTGDIGNARSRKLVLEKARLVTEQQAWTPFDLTQGPLFRARLLQLGANEHILVLILHHIIVDGWSLGVFFEEISQAYSGAATGQSVRLQPPALQFADFAAWQQAWCTSDAAARQIAYWRDCLRGAQPLFSADTGPAGGLGASTAEEPVQLSNDLVGRLNALGRSQGATLFMTLLTGFKAMLLARNGRGDICVATAMANRPEHATERVIGPFENTILIRTRLEQDLSFREALGRVRDSVLEAHAQQDIPFEVLAARLAEDGVDPASLTQVFFVLQNAMRRPLELRDIAVRSFGNLRDGQPVLPIDRTWLTVMMKEGPSGIAGLCTYKDDLFGTGTLRQWMADYQAILVRAASDPELPIGRSMVD